MDEPPRWRGGEGYGACFDDMRAAGCIFLSKKAYRAFFDSLNQSFFF